ncbi:MAG: cysteine desulfurase [Hyphomicrobiales bacterium]|nr:cysteine desulfurase [Hyphomicrobiales bacterium]MBV9426827.1 cysteine desulfurase [Bradyrhizobiaceae bacterium]
MTERTYLDWNATAPLRPEARAAVIAALDAVGNPSSVHAEGRAARRLIDEARRRVAALVGAEPADVVFTSGGSEANATALCPRAAADVLLVSTIEHPSVLAGGRFRTDALRTVPVGADGVIDLAALERQLAAGRDGRRVLVSLMHANNETGVVQPVAAAAAIVHAVGGLLHVDAVQTAGRIPCDISALGADLLTVSGHKLGGPKGVGALVRRSEAITWPEPLIRGGGQERGSRAGTENVAAIAGFGAAAAAATRSLPADGLRLAALRDRLEAQLKAEFPQTVIFGAAAERLPNTTLFALPRINAETAVIGLDLAGVAVSSGAACSSGKVAASHVLAAMGVPGALARGAVRMSLGYATEEVDIERFLVAWRALAETLSKESRGMAA